MKKMHNMVNSNPETIKETLEIDGTDDMKELSADKNKNIYDENTIVMMGKEDTIDKIVLSINEENVEILRDFLNSTFTITNCSRSVKINIYDTLKKYYKTEFKYTDDDGVYHHEFEARFNTDLTFEEILVARLDLVEFINLYVKQSDCYKDLIKVDYMLSQKDNYITTDEILFNPYLVTYKRKEIYNAFVFLKNYPKNYSTFGIGTTDNTDYRLIKARKLNLQAKNSRIINFIGGFENIEENKMDIKKLYNGDFSTLKFTSSDYNKVSRNQKLFMDINREKGNVLGVVTLSVDKENYDELKELDDFIKNIDKYNGDDDVFGLNFLFSVRRSDILENDNECYIKYLFRFNEDIMDKINCYLNNIIEYINNKKLHVNVGYLIATFNSIIKYGNIKNFFPDYLLTLVTNGRLFFKFYDFTFSIKLDFAMTVEFEEDVEFEDGSMMKSVDRRINVFEL